MINNLNGGLEPKGYIKIPVYARKHKQLKMSGRVELVQMVNIPKGLLENIYR